MKKFEEFDSRNYHRAYMISGMLRKYLFGVQIQYSKKYELNSQIINLNLDLDLSKFT